MTTTTNDDDDELFCIIEIDSRARVTAAAQHGTWCLHPIQYILYTRVHRQQKKKTFENSTHFFGIKLNKKN